MVREEITRRRFMGNTAAVGLAVPAHPTFNARVFGANDRLVMGIIGAGGMGRGTGVRCRVSGVRVRDTATTVGSNEQKSGFQVSGSG